MKIAQDVAAAIGNTPLIKLKKASALTGCTILDCDNVGLLAKNLIDSRISGSLFRDDRPNAKSLSLQAIGGGGNMIVGNLLASPPQIPDDIGLVKDNLGSAAGR